MRQRITYLLPHGTGVDPADIRVDKAELQFRKVDEAAEERRITLGLSELPNELQVFLDDFHELHIRVSSLQQYDAFLPAVARLPPGLHIFFTPRKPDGDTKLCSALKRLLGRYVKCSTSSESFSRPPILSERFASSSTYQFYQDPHFLALFQRSLRTELCRMISDATPLEGLCKAIAEGSPTTYIDIDFDVISHAVTIILFWNPPNTTENALARPEAQKLDPGDRLEVGILSPEKPSEPEELSLGGYLTVVGEDDKPSATLFSFPARHHPLPPEDTTTYAVHFQPPTGLHPTLNITFPSQAPNPPKDSCSLHAYWTIPSFLFIDRYQLSDPLFLASQNLISLRAISGEQDLEAPDWAVSQWGSAALLELAHRSNRTSPASAWSVTVPTHLRYINSTTSTAVSVPWPVVFWACEAEEGLKMGTNPFDRVNLGYDVLFGPKTMFYHIPPAHGAEMVAELMPPTLKEEWIEWVPLGTAVAVIMGFGWVCWQLLRSIATTGTDESKATESKSQ